MVVVDRIEGDLAVCEMEDGTMKSIEVALFEPAAYEGGVYDEADGRYIYNELETARRRFTAAALTAELFGE